MTDLAKLRLARTTRAIRFAFIAWTFAQPAAAQQFQPVPPPASGRSALPATPVSGQRLLSKLRKGGAPEVAFRVAVKDGKVNFTARGLKGAK